MRSGGAASSGTRRTSPGSARRSAKPMAAVPPKVLDPFAGGGAIPLEAMRLGCEATAIDINPVAWFILKCTLEYPQKLAGQKRPLPDFILHNRPVHGGVLQGTGLERRRHPQAARTPRALRAGTDEGSPAICSRLTALSQADLAWHVRAWGQWVLDRARTRTGPVLPDLRRLRAAGPGGEVLRTTADAARAPDRGRHARLAPLNGEFSGRNTSPDKRNPRWVAKPTVAYLWARTVTCKNCRAAIPLLKTRWLCKRDAKRVLLTMTVERRLAARRTTIPGRVRPTLWRTSSATSTPPNPPPIFPATCRTGGRMA